MGAPASIRASRRDVGEVLRLVVVADEALGEVAVVRLVGDPTVGVAEDVDGRDVDDARDARRDRRIEDALGGADVGLVHRRPLGRRDADPVGTGDVDDTVRAGHDLAQLRFGAEIAADEPRAQPAQVLGSAGLRVADDRDDVVASGAQEARDATADEPGGTGDDDGCAHDRDRRARVSRQAYPVRQPRARS